MSNVVKIVCTMFGVVSQQENGVLPEHIAQHVSRVSTPLLGIAKSMGSAVELVKLLQAVLYRKLLPAEYDNVIDGDSKMSFEDLQASVKHSSVRAKVRERSQANAVMVARHSSVNVVSGVPAVASSPGLSIPKGSRHPPTRAQPRGGVGVHPDRRPPGSFHDPAGRRDWTHSQNTPSGVRSASQHGYDAGHKKHCSHCCDKLGKPEHLYSNHNDDRCFELYPQMRKAFFDRKRREYAALAASCSEPVAFNPTPADVLSYGHPPPGNRQAYPPVLHSAQPSEVRPQSDDQRFNADVDAAVETFRQTIIANRAPSHCTSSQFSRFDSHCDLFDQVDARPSDRPLDRSE
jgi:hypothetical protein